MRCRPPCGVSKAFEDVKAADTGHHGAHGAGAYPQATLLAHGFTNELLAGLVRDGLATAQSKTVQADGRMIEVVRVMITDAGRKALD